MKLLHTFAYRVKRFFKGSSGIVQKIEISNEYDPDQLGSLRQRVTYQTPLDELLVGISPLETKTNNSSNGMIESVDYYKIYDIGDRFP